MCFFLIWTILYFPDYQILYPKFESLKFKSLENSNLTICFTFLFSNGFREGTQAKAVKKAQQ